MRSVITSFIQFVVCCYWCSTSSQAFVNHETYTKTTPRRSFSNRSHGSVSALPMETTEWWMTLATETSYRVSSEPIHTAFSVATFLPQPFWLLMILAPKSTWTKKIMGGLGTFGKSVWHVYDSSLFQAFTYTRSSSL